MLSFAIRRVLISIPMLLLITLLMFAFLKLAPGDPLDAMVKPMESGIGPPPKLIEYYKQKFHLGEPFYVQYWFWLSSVVQGDFGLRTTDFSPISKSLAQRLPLTAMLAGGAIVMAIIIGVPIGIISAVYRYSVLDHAVTFFAFTGISIPLFFSGFLMLFIFSLNLGIAPTGGVDSPFIENDTIDIIYHLWLPSLTLSIAMLAAIARFMRSSVIEEFNRDYARTARAKGVSEIIVLLKHVLRNSASAVATIISLRLPMLVGGAVIAESIFNWPGMGLLLRGSIMGRDYPTIVAIVLVMASAVLLSNLLVDLAYGWLNPRIRY